MELKTERLVLREPRMEDAGRIRALASDLEVSQYLAAVPYPYKEGVAESWISSCIALTANSPRQKYVFFITVEGAVIGSVGLESIDYEKKSATIGYWLGKAYWRLGYMSEALGAVIAFGFEELELTSIRADVFVENIASCALLEKLGFVKVGEKIATSGATGKKHNCHKYVLSR